MHKIPLPPNGRLEAVPESSETIFNWDGLGRALVTAVGAQDNPVVLGVAVYGIAAFIMVNLVVDLVSAALDPRIRLDA